MHFFGCCGVLGGGAPRIFFTILGVFFLIVNWEFCDFCMADNDAAQGG